MKTESKLSFIFFMLAAAVLLFMVMPVWATDDECRGHSCNDSGSTVVTNSLGDNSVVNKSRSFGIGGSDADIAGCRFTEGGLTIQWTRQDKFCQAQRLIDQGYVDTGVLALCTKTWIGDLYSDLAACRGALVSKYTPVVVAEEPVVVEFDEDEEDWHQEQLQIQQDYDERIALLESRLQSKPQVIERKVEEPWMTAEKRAKLQAVLDE